MVVEYTIEAACEPKRKLGREGLLERLRCLARLREDDAPGKEAALEARKADFQLRPLAFHCARCPANHARRPFGCFGVIQGPISQEAEEWLVDLLPETLTPRREAPPELGRQAGFIHALARRMRELGVNGKAVDDSHRADGLFEGRRPVSRKFGPIFRTVRISSSQLLHWLLFRAKIEPSDAELICRALAVWEDGGKGEDGVPEVVFTQPPDEDDDPSVVELKQLFMALIVACSLDLDVRTEVQEFDAPEEEEEPEDDEDEREPATAARKGGSEE
jgi:hypothetical protein